MTDIELTPETFLENALYTKSCSIFQAMMDQSEEDAFGIKTWSGRTTHLIMGQLKISSPYYTGTLRALKIMGCIVQEKRGAGANTLSVWRLNYEPTPQMWLERVQKPVVRNRRDVNNAQNAQKLLDLGRRIDSMENLLKNIIRLLAKDDVARLSTLEMVPEDALEDDLTDPLNDFIPGLDDDVDDYDLLSDEGEEI